MEGGGFFREGSSVNLAGEVKLEEDEEEFRSCCEDEDEDELKEREESVKKNNEEEGEEEGVELDEDSVKMYFKGVSVVQPGDNGAGFSGIGVVMERSCNTAPIQVQKRLDFCVEESVADYFALMDGLLEATHEKVKRVFAFTNSKALYDQVMHGKQLQNPLHAALSQRVLENANYLDAFVLKYAAHVDLQTPLQLAKVAAGIVSFPNKGDISVESCSICCQEKLSSMMVEIRCSHRFCSHCMKSYVEGKVQSGRVPIRCLELSCKYYISASECKSFLPVTSYITLEQALAEAKILILDKIYCPYPNCSVLLDPHECSSSRASSSSQSSNSCVECPVCQRFICVDCGVPWHSSFSCEEYQSLPADGRGTGDITLHLLAQNNRWRHCQQCQRIIELRHGCYHMTCWCGHEFCFSCGVEYRDGHRTCQCAFWSEEYDSNVEEHPAQQFEQWSWDSFESIPMMMDAYSDQERSQLALIQRFLAGGFSLTDHNTDQPPPSGTQSPPSCTDSYVDAMKDLQQLPWLERFVSVISDNYYEDYNIQ